MVGWLRGGVEEEAVFVLGAADPMVGLLVASIRFDFFAPLCCTFCMNLSIIIGVRWYYFYMRVIT